MKPSSAFMQLVLLYGGYSFQENIYLNGTLQALHKKKITKIFFRVYISMWFAPVVAIGICVYLIFYHPFTLWFAFPALVMWLLSPAIVWWLSKPISPDKKEAE